MISCSQVKWHARDRDVGFRCESTLDSQTGLVVKELCKTPGNDEFRKQDIDERAWRFVAPTTPDVSDERPRNPPERALDYLQTWL